MIAYPISVDSSGGLLISSDSLKDQVLALLDCLFFERVIFTDFGTDLAAFDPTSESDLNLLLANLKMSLNYWISPDIEVTIQPTDLELGVVILMIELPNSEPIQFDLSSRKVLAGELTIS